MGKIERKEKEQKDPYEQLKEFALQEGASLFGVAETSAVKDKFHSFSPETLQGLDRAIALAFHLSDRIMENLVDGPTKLYFFHYQRVNVLLDELGLKVTNFIQARGWQALPIPASQIIDWEKQRAHVSHKHVARQAGLGWIGRNNLLVRPDFGARLRLITVLTNMPLKVDKPLPWGCQDCRACLSSCPSQSIKERPEDFDHLGCYQQIKVLVKAAGISQNICGLCVKACPGKKQ
ncbi:MAG: epoxyqueuosine reductase [Deltaproteobacteria bacterium]|nr:epoxyqueuosine reductase [Deltaproteobacteria bacterium]